jgi:hypothetical protein
MNYNEKILCHNALGLEKPEVSPGQMICVKVCVTGLVIGSLREGAALRCVQACSLVALCLQHASGGLDDGQRVDMGRDGQDVLRHGSVCVYCMPEQYGIADAIAVVLFDPQPRSGANKLNGLAC